MRSKRRAKRTTGRPPSGVRSGEKVSEYPQVTLRLPPETKAKLYALSVVTATTQWRVVNAALECFFRERSETEQKKVIKAVAEHLRTDA
jgi:predicted DNA-binding protein